MKKAILSFLSTTGLVLLAPSLINAQYCIPETNCTVGDGVVEFGIGPFLNTSACGSDAGTPGYSDFTDLTGLSLAAGVTYDGSFRSDFGNQQFSIWIDSDNSDSFESSELIMADLAVGTELVVSPVNIPFELPLGQYRLRLQASYNAPSSLDACDINSSWGETEDYTITVTEPPTCPNVSAINLDAVSATSATISWSDPGTASVWDLEVGPAGFTPTGIPSPGLDNVTNPYTIEDLSPVTTYDVYIRADCGEDNESDVSLWTSAFTFVTACGAAIPDYYEDMNDGVLECWSFFGGGDISTGPLEEGFVNWFNNGFAGIPNLFEGSQGISMFGSGVNQWMISPDIDLSAGDFQTEFDLSMTAGGFGQQLTLAPDDEFFFLVSSDFGITWDTLGYWNESNGVDPLGEHFAYSLEEYTGEIARFAFYITNGEVDDFNFFQAYVDNFRVQSVGSPLSVTIDFVVEPNCFEFGGNPLADVIISVAGGTPPYTFDWSNGAETEDLLDAEPGTVTLTVTDNDGNSFTSEEIFIPGTPVLSITAVITNESEAGAADGMVEITSVEGGTGPYNYIWNNGATTNSIDGLIDAFWCVQVSDINNCSSDTCVEVFEGDPLSLIEANDILSLQVFPNPTYDGLFNLQMELGQSKNLGVELYDAMGRVILKEVYNRVLTVREQYNISGQSKGIYTLRLTDLDTGKTRSILVSR